MKSIQWTILVPPLMKENYFSHFGATLVKSCAYFKPFMADFSIFSQFAGKHKLYFSAVIICG